MNSRLKSAVQAAKDAKCRKIKFKGQSIIQNMEELN